MKSWQEKADTFQDLNLGLASENKSRIDDLKKVNT